MALYRRRLVVDSLRFARIVAELCKVLRSSFRGFVSALILNWYSTAHPFVPGTAPGLWNHESEWRASPIKSAFWGVEDGLTFVVQAVWA